MKNDYGYIHRYVLPTLGDQRWNERSEKKERDNRPRGGPGFLYDLEISFLGFISYVGYLILLDAGYGLLDNGFLYFCLRFIRLLGILGFSSLDFWRLWIRGTFNGVKPSKGQD